MDWHHYTWIFLLSSVKFLFAPTTGITVISYWECILVTTAGGVFGTTLFYFTGNGFFRWMEKNRKRKDARLERLGVPVVRKKFTRTNRFTIRIKRSFGLWGIAFITPALISIPIGSVIISRFYPNPFKALTVLYIMVVGWSFILTTFGETLFKWIGLL